MISPYITTVGRSCLHFFVHAVGQTLGRFSVFTVSQSGMEEQWDLHDKFQEIFWTEVRLPIEEAVKFQESILTKYIFVEYGFKRQSFIQYLFILSLAYVFYLYKFI